MCSNLMSILAVEVANKAFTGERKNRNRKQGKVDPPNMSGNETEAKSYTQKKTNLLSALTAPLLMCLLTPSLNRLLYSQRVIEYGKHVAFGVHSVIFSQKISSLKESNFFLV